MFWTLSSMGRPCLDFFIYSVFYILSWPQYRSSLHSVSFSRVWETSFAWQIPDVLPEFISGSFTGPSLTSMCMCVLMPVKNCSLIRDLVNQLPSSPTALLPPPQKKKCHLSSLRSVTNSFPFYTFHSPCINKSCSIFAWNAVLLKFLQSVFIVSLLAVLIENY